MPLAQRPVPQRIRSQEILSVVKNLFGSALVFLFSGLTLSHAETATGSTTSAPTPFAIISPQMAARFQALSASVAAKSIIADADTYLQRPPAPMARVHTEGTLPHQGIRDESIKSEADWAVMLKLAFAWQITHDSRYLQAAEKYLNAWMDVYKVSFNPIDETNMDRLILTHDLTAAHLSEVTRVKIQAFLQTMSQGYLAQIQSKNDSGNWQSHRIKLATLAAFALGDDKLIAQAKAAYDAHLAKNLQADSSTYDFHLRDALHYTVYDLEPLTTCAIAAKVHHQDWFHDSTPNQASVATAIDWLIPYATGEKTHEEFLHSPVKFDAQRAQAGEKGFSGIWDPLSSIYLFQLAALLDPKYQAIAEQLAQKGAHAQDWSTLLLQAGM